MALLELAMTFEAAHGLIDPLGPLEKKLIFGAISTHWALELN